MGWAGSMCGLVEDSELRILEEHSQVSLSSWFKIPESFDESYQSWKQKGLEAQGTSYLSTMRFAKQRCMSLGSPEKQN